jgi:hypothetical protein
VECCGKSKMQPVNQQRTIHSYSLNGPASM